MRAPPSALLPILRSALQGEVLAATYLSPEREFSVSELSRMAAASLKATSQEVQRLVVAGLLADRHAGNQRLVRKPPGGRIVAPLAELLAATYGPKPVLAEELADIEGIQQAYIYGSWAARHEGERGGAPDDIDVLIVGTAAFEDLDDASERASARLHRAVNVRRIPLEYWDDPPSSDTFVATVKNHHLVPIPGFDGDGA